jgi:hypothetical protein
VTNDQIEANNIVTEWVGLSQYQVQKVVLSSSGVDVILVGEGALPPLETLSKNMEEQFGRMMVIRLHTIPEKKVTYPSVLAGL